MSTATRIERVGRSGAGGNAWRSIRQAAFEHHYNELLQRLAQPAALQAELRSPGFVAWLLQRLLVDKRDLQLLAKHILDQLDFEDKDGPAYRDDEDCS